MSELLPRPAGITRRISVILGIPFLLGLAALTLSPSRVEQTAPALLDEVLRILRDDLAWTWMGFNTLEVLANILVFVPVGILAFLLVPRRFWLLAFLVGPLLSLAIEGVQWAALPARAATLADVLANSAGATIGVGLAVIATLLTAPRHAHPLETR